MKIKKVLNVIEVELGQKVFKYIPDELYLKLLFRIRVGEKLDIKNPVSFNQKLQWLKLYDRKSEYANWADKYLVREYVREKIGDEYLVPLLGVWENFCEINWDKLPCQFVLKTTHDSGGVVVCRDKSKLDKKRTEKIIIIGEKGNGHIKISYQGL